jgi:tRNA(fMet)-specific endonuclease VapC
MVVLDTDVLIAMLRGDDSITDAVKQREARDEKLCIASHTAFELLSGAMRSRNPELERARLVETISSLYVLDFSYLEAEAAARIDAELLRKGTPIGTIDTFIAATCIVASQPLVTRNAKHFQKVKELKTEKW